MNLQKRLLAALCAALFLTGSPLALAGEVSAQSPDGQAVTQSYEEEAPKKEDGRAEAAPDSEESAAPQAEEDPADAGEEDELNQSDEAQSPKDTGNSQGGQVVTDDYGLVYEEEVEVLPSEEGVVIPQSDEHIVEDTTLEVTLTAGDGRNNYLQLQDALSRADGVHKLTVVIANTGSFEIAPEVNIALQMRSNTVLDLNGATLLRDGAMGNLIQVSDLDGGHISTGYNLAQNITVKNGTLNGKNGSELPCNLVNVGHSANLTFSNVTFLNCRGGHLLEMTGCKNCLVEKCTFSGYQSSDNSVGEAVQLDICSSSNGDSWNGVYCTDEAGDGTPCQDITITGCTFQNYPTGVGNHHTLTGHHNKKITIKNNRFANNSTPHAPAIWAYGFDNSTISNNEITGKYVDGIRVSAGSVTISGNTIGSSKSPVSCSGFYITLANSYVWKKGVKCTEEHVSNTTVKKNKVYSKSSEDAFKVLGASKIKAIQENKIHSTRGGALLVSGKSNVTTVSSNTLTSKKDGFTVEGRGKVSSVTNNSINSERDGITASGGGSIGSINKTTVRASDAGVILKSKGKITTLSDGSVYGKDEAVKVDGGAHLTTISNEKMESGGRGLYVTGSGSQVSTMSKSHISAKKDGVYVSSKGTVSTCKNNSINSSGGAGIYVRKGASLKYAQSNTVSARHGKGIHVSGGSIRKISGNSISRAGSDGIRVSSGKVSSGISSNKISGCKGHGIYVSSSASTGSVSGNSVKNCSGYGIYMANTALLSKVHGNSCSGNKQGNVWEPVVEPTVTAKKKNKKG